VRPCTLARHQADGGDPADDAARHGQCRDGQRPQRTEGEQQQQAPWRRSPAIASRSTSDLMVARESTAKTPAPVSSSCRPGRSSAGEAVAHQPLRLLLRVRGRRHRRGCWPPARRAACVRDTQTPSSTRGAAAGSMASAMRTVLARGIAPQQRLDARAGGRPQQPHVSSIASRSPSTLKRAGSTPGLSR
jgi:hypothetical protein